MYGQIKPLSTSSGCCRALFDDSQLSAAEPHPGAGSLPSLS